MNDVTVRFLECYNLLISEEKFADKKDFAEKIGVSTSLITEISKKRSNVGVTAIQNIVIVFGIDANWLLTGKGNMFLDNNTFNNSNDMNCNECPYKRMFDKMEKDSDWYQAEIDRLNQKLDALQAPEMPQSKQKCA